MHVRSAYAANCSMENTPYTILACTAVTCCHKIAAVRMTSRVLTGGLCSGIIKGHTRSLDYSSCGVARLFVWDCNALGSGTGVALWEKGMSR